jgi:hypothetical protein
MGENMQPDSRGKLIRWKVFQRESEGRKVMHDGSLRDDDYVYHMLIWPYARAIFENARLRLSPVGRWTDPYEKWWCDVLFGRSTPLAGLEAYGLCWTTGQYDEPRWRMAAFRQGDPIVRIRCRAKTILTASHRLLGSKHGSIYFGKVRYVPARKLSELSQSVSGGERKEVTRTAATMLLHKRNAFKFEEEVRLLWLDHGPSPDAVYLDIDPATAVDQVMVSPYAKEDEYEAVKADLARRGVTTKRSLLLRAPVNPALEFPTPA